MKVEMFDELVGSVREGGAILRGAKKASRRFVIGAADLRATEPAAALLRIIGRAPELAVETSRPV